LCPFFFLQLPPEYLSLLRELSNAQQPQAPALQAAAPHAQHLPNAQQFNFPHDPQYGLSQNGQPDSNIHYISEEEYIQLLKKQEQGQQQQQPQFHHQQQQQPQHLHQQQQQPQHHQPQPHQYIQVPQQNQVESLGSYRTPAKQVKEQPQHHHQQPAQVQYKPAVYKTQHPRPLADLTLEQELDKLSKHNRPVVSFEPQQIVQAASPVTPSSRQYVSQTPAPQYSHSTPAHAYVTPQAQPSYTQQYHEHQYVAPVLRNPHQHAQQPQQHQQPQQASSIQHEQTERRPKFESPAQKYQLIIPEEPYKSYTQEPVYKYGQQLQFKNVGPQSVTGTKLQYYLAKEKEHIRESQSQNEQIYQAPNAMKIVAAPQLQHEKPASRKPEEASKKHHSSSHGRTQSQKQHQSQRQHHQKHSNQQPKQQNNQQPQKQSASYQQPKQEQKQYAEAPPKSTIFVSQNTGANEHQSRHPSEDTVRVGAEGVPLPKSNRPLTEEEFQRLVDAGYSVVPVPVPVHTNNNYQQQPQAQSQSQPQKYVAPAPIQQTFNGHPTQRQSHQYRYLPQQQGAENAPVVTYLRPLHQQPA
jgi:hypothetical protein